MQVSMQQSGSWVAQVRSRRTTGRRPRAPFHPQAAAQTPARPKWAGGPQAGSVSVCTAGRCAAAQGCSCLHNCTHQNLMPCQHTSCPFARFSSCLSGASAVMDNIPCLLPTCHPPPAGDDLLSKLVNVVIQSPLFGLLKQGARARIKDTAEKRGVPWQQRVFELEHSEVRLWLAAWPGGRRCACVVPGVEARRV